MARASALPLLLLLSCLSVFAQETLFNLISSRNDLTTLVASLSKLPPDSDVAAKLSDPTATLTLFAPSNSALDGVDDLATLTSDPVVWNKVVWAGLDGSGGGS